MPASEEVWSAYQAQFEANQDRFVKRDAYMMAMKGRIETLPEGSARDAAINAMRAVLVEWESDPPPPLPPEIEAEAQEGGQ